MSLPIGRQHLISSSLYRKSGRPSELVPKKIGDQLWNDFLAACNRFFEARNAVHADSRNEEHENLNKKRDIIEPAERAC